MVLESLEVRERLALYGYDGLSELELLSIVIGADRAVRVLDGLLDTRYLLVAGEDELVARGFTRRQAERFRAMVAWTRRAMERKNYSERKQIRSPSCVYELLNAQVSEYPYQEQFFVVPIDSKNRVLCIERISLGILNAAYVEVREIFCIAIRHRAAAVITAHNHPSGDPYPSPVDIALARRITDAGRLIGIKHTDHIVIGGGVCTSLREAGHLERSCTDQQDTVSR
jgi:DNA repair protein RadC